MKEWPDKCVDMALTSPPYGTLRDYNGYVFDFEGIANQLFRVIKKGGVLVWVVKDETVNGSESGESFRQALYFKSIGFNLHDTMIYSKNGVNFPAPNRYYDTFEYMFVFSKYKPVSVNLIEDRQNYWTGSVGSKNSGTCRQKNGEKKQRSESFKAEVKNTGRRWNIWSYCTGFNLSSKEKTAFEHPAIFPEDLAKDHIISWSNPDDIILDPMSGSGTTCKMAKLLGRRYIGVDISPAYCKIARERLEAVNTGVPVKEARKGQIPLFQDLKCSL